MPRPSRFVIPGIPHHVTQRGNYKQQTFFTDADYGLYLRLLRVHADRFEVTVQAYCLMPNHAHLILTPPHEDALPGVMQRIHADYARIVHVSQEKTGHLWQARYYSTPMDDAHFWHAMAYVEQNPKRAGLVGRCQDWPWSSAAARLLGTYDGLLDIDAWRRRHTAATWEECLRLGLRDADIQQRIREATGKGWPLGSDRFLAELENQLGRPVRPRPPGRRAQSGFMVSDTN
jgi:putative transposase